MSWMRCELVAMPADAILTRIDCSDEGTFGRIVGPGIALFTGELPWRENRPSISCIPDGAYRVVWTWSPRFRRLMYLVGGVAARSGIRKHPANLMGDAALGYKSQLNGCIAFGERLGWLDGQKAVLLSAPAVRRFEEAMKRQPFNLEIRHA